jgi:hypothetical protein
MVEYFFKKKNIHGRVLPRAGTRLPEQVVEGKPVLAEFPLEI